MDKRIAPGSIVVAVDGSEHAERAVRWGSEQAELEHRRLVVLSVAEWGKLRNSSFLAGVTLEDLGQSARSVAGDAAALARELTPDVAVEATGLLGDPRQVLVDVSTGAHLVVMGSRGRGPLRSMFLGSVSSAVVKQARCPVVVCRSDSDRAQGAGVVVGADGTAESLPVLAFAFEQASLRGLPLTVVHAYWDAITALAELEVLARASCRSQTWRTYASPCRSRSRGSASDTHKWTCRCDWLTDSSTTSSSVTTRGVSWSSAATRSTPSPGC